MNEKINNVVLVLGKRGYGKSVWTKYFLSNQPRVFLFDPVGDYDQFYYITREDLEHIDMDTLRDKNHSFKIATSDPSCLEFLASLAFLTGDCWLVIEEASYVFPPKQYMPEYLRDIVFLGRHNNCSLLLTAQRAVSIPIDMRSQATRVVSFRQVEAADMKWLEDYFGERTWDVPELSKLECLDCENENISQYRMGIAFTKNN